MAQQTPTRVGRNITGRLLSIISWLVIVFICVAAVVAFVVPDFARQQLEQVLSTESFTARIDKLTLNPLTLDAAAYGVSLQQSDGSKPLQLEQLNLNLSLESVLQRALVFDEVVVVNAVLLGRLDRRRQFNWQQYIEQLVPPSTAGDDVEAEADSGPPRVLAHVLLLKQVNIRFADEGKREPFSEQFGPIDIDVKDLTTLPRPGAPYSIVASTSRAERIQWRGEIELNPLRSSGTLDISGWQLPLVWNYFKDDIAFEVADGKAALKTAYHYDGNLSISNAVLTVEGLRLLDRLENPTELLKLPLLQLAGIDFNLDRKRIDIADITLSDLQLRDTISPQGASQLAAVFAAPPAEGAAQPKTAGEQSGTGVDGAEAGGAGNNEFSLGVEAFSVENAAVTLRHQLSESRHSEFELEQANLELKGFAYPEGTVDSVSVDGRINETATVTVVGKGTIDPLQSDFELDVANFKLLDLMPYIEPYLAIDLRSGYFNAQIKGQISQDGAELASAAKGSVAVTELLVNDTGKGAKILSVDALKVNDMSWDSNRAALDIAQVELVKAYAKVVIYKDGSTNISRLAVEQAVESSSGELAVSASAAESKTQAAENAGAPLQVNISTIDFEDGTADFADLSLPRNFKAAIYDIKGTIRGLASTGKGAAVIDITGAVDRYAPVTLRGKVSPLSDELEVDLDLAFRNLELTAVSPYSDTYAGYNIDKGKLHADFKYVIDGTALRAENKVVIDQLTLGSPTGSPTATSLPVVLAVALLKDRRGVIDLNLPVSGDIGDPKFHYGALIGKALVNMITKIIASPFAALGSLVGGGEDMDNIAFEPGRSDLSAAETSKLAQLAEALNDRPQLSISIRGTAVPVKDGAALREAHLIDHLKDIVVAVPIPDDAWKPVFKQYKKTMGTSVRRLTKQIKAEQELDKPALQQVVRERVWQDLLAAEKITEDDYLELARARSEQVREALVDADIDPGRIFLLDPVVDESGEKGPRCQLELEPR